MQEADDDVIEEAARWFAHLRGPDAEQSRAQFDLWLSKSPRHLAAYNEVAELFGTGKVLKRETEEVVFSRWKPVRPRVMSLAITSAIAASAFILLIHADRQRLRDEAAASAPEYRARYVAAKDRPYGVGLADGTTVTLSVGSRVRIAYSLKQRTLVLLAGRARFDVAHDRRPFLVLVAGSRVTAHGTIFDVALAPGGRAIVQLLQGVVEVDAQTRERQKTHQRLSAGERILVDGTGHLGSPSPLATLDDHWPAGRVDYEQASISAVLAAANRQSPVPLLLKDPELEKLRVSGTFSLDHPVQLAQALAASFDLDLRFEPSGSIILDQHR